MQLFRIGLSFGGSLFILFSLLLVKLKFISYDKRILMLYIISLRLQDFISRYKKVAILILLLIGLYRIADIVMGVMANVFYLEKGYRIRRNCHVLQIFWLICNYSWWDSLVDFIPCTKESLTELDSRSDYSSW